MILHVKPARPDLTVLMPDAGMEHMPSEGTIVPWDAYYLQLLAHGDLVMVETADPALDTAAGVNEPTTTPTFTATPKAAPVEAESEPSVN